MKPARPHILFITQWQYADALIQTYTLPYIAIIHRQIQTRSYLVTTIKNKKGRIEVKKRGSNAIIELPDNKSLLQWFTNIFSLICLVKKKKIPYIHTFCMPAGAIGAILKFMQPRVKLILDSVEPHAESMAECNIWKRNSLKFRLLFFFEKLQIWKADRLILAEKDMPVYIKNTYHLTISDYFVKPSCVDLEMFSARCIKEPGLLSYLNLEDKVVCVYAGKFGGFYLKDEIFKFIRACQEYWGRNKFRFLLLSNADEAFLKDMTVKYGIEEDAVIKLFVPHAEIPKYIGLADFALSPYKPVPSKRFGTPIKNGEYWAMGLPVVITPGISEDSNIITENNAGVVLNGFTEEDFLHAITQIDKTISHKSRMEVYIAIRPLAEKYRNFSIAEEVYGKLYSGLVTC